MGLLTNTASIFSLPSRQLSMPSRKERERGRNGEKQRQIEDVTVRKTKNFEFGIRKPNRKARCVTVRPMLFRPSVTVNIFN